MAIKDDSLVDVLLVQQYVDAQKAYVHVDVAPMRDLAEDLHLFSRIDRGEWHSELGHVREHERRSRESTYDTFDDFYTQLPDDSRADESLPPEWRRSRDLVERMMLPFRQLDRLKASQVQIRELAAVFGTNEHDFEPIRDIVDATRHMIMDLWNRMTQVDLGVHPSKSGDSKIYGKAVSQALETYKARHTGLFPLRVPISVTLLHTPPASGSIDLDNVVRRVIGRLRETFEPPTTMLNGLDPDQVSDPKLQEILKKMPASKRALVTQYEAYALPRRSSDPAEGRARLGLAPAGFEAPPALDELQRHLDACAEASLGW